MLILARHALAVSACRALQVKNQPGRSKNLRFGLEIAACEQRHQIFKFSFQLRLGRGAGADGRLKNQIGSHAAVFVAHHLAARA
jgi:hypothetical protein